MPLQLVVAIPTFVCSCLSLLASTTFAIFYLIFPPERHFRQALIVNLLVADLINSANNTVSGAVALSRRHDAEALKQGPACIANGYIGQFSVQAIDFNILIISVAVLLTIRQSRIVTEPPWWQVILICAIPWIPPIITRLHFYGPVSGNWCWIQATHFSMRYALTHAWRIAIFVLTIAIYTYVYIYLKRVYGKLHISTTSGHTGIQTETEMQHDMPPPDRHIRVRSSIITSHESDEQLMVPGASGMAKWPEDNVSTTHSTAYRKGRYALGSSAEIRAVVLATPAAEKARERKTALRKMLLLNGYPTLYILLWMPGIANRIAEAFGTSPTWLRVAQASTQLVGLANAMTYAYNEQLRGRMRGRTTRRMFS
ncbi:hypothetical protein DOTSEDRAFT_127749 [Dothistroma septosporum NZE10]|uniref:Glucose receptor Git3-like N-terminal domain-containing protein n=1 Tax=Dothistroma septosporum (strain NZE10 / CBS 128990) TaxID=675120 RepID=N1PRU9_DOTSN|nr:hypothetical protein DOTSEDRAFT_127749 [Dothistroma septosporum NZE10]